MRRLRISSTAQRIPPSLFNALINRLMLFCFSHRSPAYRVIQRDPLCIKVIPARKDMNGMIPTTNVYRWKGDTSSDEIVGHFFLYSIACDHLEDRDSSTASETPSVPS